MQCYFYARCKEGLAKVFWRPDGKGYTVDLKQAGIFESEDYADRLLITSKDHMEAMLNDSEIAPHLLDHVLIPVNKIEEILGKRQVCIL